MKEIVVISGKGGTGKTSITAALSFLAGNDAVIADCDVDAADMHLLLSPDFAYHENFHSGELAVINNETCTGCGLCLEKCRFSAISAEEFIYRVNEIDCEGCGYCSRICPVDAIEMKEQLAGEFYISGSRLGSRLVHARLLPGAENSGKLVAKVKKESRNIAEKEGLKYIIADGSPGIGCPVISSLTGADFVVLVTEPSVSGVHDLKRVYQLVQRFKIPASCIINKYDINPRKTKEIKEFLNLESIMHLADIPYDRVFTEAITRGKTIMENGTTDIRMVLSDIWYKIKNNLTDTNNKK